MPGAVAISISGTLKVNQAIDVKVEQIRKRVENTTKGAGIDCQAGAKKSCPVDTGRLRSSISVHNERLGTGLTYKSSVGTDVFYSWYVECGTSRHGPQPFLYPAFLDTVVTFQDELRAIH